MAETQTGIRPVHLVGSVAYDSVETAFDRFGQHLDFCAKYFPDGEPGARMNWIMWQDRVIRDHPQFERIGERVDPRNPDSRFPLYRLRPDAPPESISFGPLGYEEVAAQSFEIYQRKVEAGVLPGDSRFMVALPTPLVFNWAFLPDPRDQELVEPAYVRAMVDEVNRLCDAIPRERLALQWDIAAEMTALERGQWVGAKTGHAPGMVRDFGDMLEAFGSRTAQLCDSVPEGVDLLVHLCYGDFGHRHSIEPSSLDHCVDMANYISKRVSRPIALIHMPVPRDRDDEAYFRPLERLRLHPETQLCLGLVHHTDGVEGTLRRMATADRVVSGYGIATECGMGRRPPETMDRLLAIHAEAARRAPVT